MCVPGISSANMTFTTKKPSKSTVFYSTSSPVLIGQTASKKSSDTGTEHSLTLSDLKSNTKYYVLITAEDLTGELLYSPEFYFTTGLTPEEMEEINKEDDMTFMEILLTFLSTRGVAASEK